MLNILLTHNFYQQSGGEDSVFEQEYDLLRQRGHKVVRLTRDNRSVESMGRLPLIRSTFWNSEVAREVKEIIHSEKIDLVHSHNTFPLISPSIYTAAKEAGVPIVQTIHNYRLVCAAATLTRNGQPCDDCSTSNSMIPAVFHRCYRSSTAATLVLTGMLRAHRVAGTWTSKVTRYIALTQFMKTKLVAGGLPAEKITVKPNFYPDRLSPRKTLGRFALFVGRLSPEKGPGILLDAWSKDVRLPLTIVGSGPEHDSISKRALNMPDVRVVGPQSSQQVFDLMRDAYCLIVPSLWYEGFPMVIIEAFAAGLPVLVSGHGSLAEIVEDGSTGLHFRPGDSDDLAAKVGRLVSSPLDAQRMGHAARAEFESKYTADSNYRMLEEIYGEALRSHAGSLSFH
ncbi:MAG: glycosyltransferase family 4 protein [Paludibaculum sp.]